MTYVAAAARYPWLDLTAAVGRGDFEIERFELAAMAAMPFA